jgi:hypothetical protein
MRTSNGFDRMSTQEELHQVLAVLDEFAQSAWTFPGTVQADSLATSLWADTLVEDSADVESLNAFMNRPGLKN